MQHINVILFDQFTTLDALGPAEVFAHQHDDYQLNYFSLEGAIVTSSTANQILTKPFSAISNHDILLIPGGWGTRTLADDSNFIAQLKHLALSSTYVLTICTGAVLLARTGLLDARRATSNKRAWQWVCAQRSQVKWVKSARWVSDGNFYTSSGIAAGIDMSLGFIRDQHGAQCAQRISQQLEYVANDDPSNDPFALKNNDH